MELSVDFREVSVIERIKIMKKGRYPGKYPYLSECSYRWPYLVSMLSGQARLVRATAEGGGGIHLIHGLSSSDSDDDDDFGDEFPCCDVPSPPGTLRTKSYFIAQAASAELVAWPPSLLYCPCRLSVCWWMPPQHPSSECLWMKTLGERVVGRYIQLIKNASFWLHESKCMVQTV